MSAEGSPLGVRIAAGIAGTIIAIAVPLIAYHEGYVPKTYADPIGIPTVCFGQTGSAAKPGIEYTRAECDAMLNAEVADTLTALDRCLAVPLEPHQWAALTSLAYNTGPSAICKSTIARMIRAGRPAIEWCEQFPRWVYAGGKVLPGLVKRRADERKLCLGEAA